MLDGSYCSGPAAAFSRLAPQSVGELGSQFDFIQNEFLPSGELVGPYEDAQGRIQFVKQESGPNIDGTPICGTVGVT